MLGLAEHFFASKSYKNETQYHRVSFTRNPLLSEKFTWTWYSAVVQLAYR